ncbi:SWI/SNF-related matrix-associated actin-dependent regulator 1 of chromatin subfamily A [Thalassospira sp. 11-3]|nr:SWI/SNF-related matrix-associated actin-dependent regulator 1 of chromatin subfamily A [Thalassospira sp. 11-3]
MQIIQKQNNYQIHVPYDHWRDYNLKGIRALSQRRWDNNLKAWVAPLSISAEIMALAKKHKAEFMVMEKSTPTRIGEVDPMPDLDFEVDIKHKTLGFVPRPYQLQGIARGLQLKRFTNGDEQGLGKTLQSLGTLYVAEKYKGETTFPALIICPASTKINWKREWEMWTDKKAIVLRDQDKKMWSRYYEMGLADVFIVNYESLKKFFVSYMPPKSKLKSSLDIQLDPRTAIFKSVIIDESHRCKDKNTQQTKIALRLAMGKYWRILLTGTPIVNKPMDLYPQLAIMGQLKRFGGDKGYRQRYCDGGYGASNLKELHYLLNKYCFFRREKKEVAKDLPEKQRQTILCNISTRKEYNHARDNFVKFLEDAGWNNAEIAKKLNGEVMVKMMELKRIAAMGKLNEAVEFTQDILESGEKLILFCSLHSIVDALKEKFPNAVTVTGRDDQDEKQKSIDSFQNDPKTQLIICNIKAAGVGITLTASSRVAFLEFPWSYADCVQCEDRAHRIGQKNNVMCTYFLGQNTVDEQMYEMIQAKASVANTITGATDEMQTNFVESVRKMFL